MHCAFCGTRQDINNEWSYCPNKGADINPWHKWVEDDLIRDETNPKDAAGASKPQLAYMPALAMEPIARVFELGVKKYGAYNWRSKKVRKLVYAHAALRHIWKWVSGESIDPESNQSHLAHVAACVMIVLDAEATGNAIEDREWLVKETS